MYNAAVNAAATTAASAVAVLLPLQKTRSVAASYDLYTMLISVIRGTNEAGVIQLW
jgi:hypothetical protein